MKIQSVVQNKLILSFTMDPTSTLSHKLNQISPEPQSNNQVIRLTAKITILSSTINQKQSATQPQIKKTVAQVGTSNSPQKSREKSQISTDKDKVVLSIKPQKKETIVAPEQQLKAFSKPIESIQEEYLRTWYEKLALETTVHRLITQHPPPIRIVKYQSQIPLSKK